MSTKCSIAYSDNVHLYANVLDEDNIYLRLSGPLTSFEAYPDSIVIGIPIHIAEQLGLPVFSSGKCILIKEDKGDE